MQRMKAIAKAITPPGLRRLTHKWQLSRLRKVNAATPIKEVFTNIYERHLWGGLDRMYCSGSGSTASHASRYALAISSLVAGKGIGTVVDLGCGDFEVGKALRINGVRYIGVDIVDALIRRNQDVYHLFRTSRFRFLRVSLGC